ncbi:MAG: hypothetical protein NVS3B14_05430 [Ktedonobacteraceae bacterium]
MAAARLHTIVQHVGFCFAGELYMTRDESQDTNNSKTSFQTILLVEDDEGIGEFIALALMEIKPYAVLHATNAAYALEAVRAIKPSLFILDFRLSEADIDGLELSDRLHSIGGFERIPTLMISAYLPACEEMQKRHITFLEKPFELDELMRTLEQLLSQLDG